LSIVIFGEGLKIRLSFKGNDGGPIRGRSSTDMVSPYRENEGEVKRKNSQCILGNGIQNVRFVHAW
jgi:hypothetical protein